MFQTLFVIVGFIALIFGAIYVFKKHIEPKFDEDGNFKKEEKKINDPILDEKEKELDELKDRMEVVEKEKTITKELVELVKKVKEGESSIDDLDEEISENPDDSKEPDDSKPLY